MRYIIIKFNYYINYHITLNNTTAPSHGIILLHRTLILVPALPGATVTIVPVAFAPLCILVDAAVPFDGLGTRLAVLVGMEGFAPAGGAGLGTPITV